MKSTIIGNEPQVKKPTFECGELVRDKQDLIVLCNGETASDDSFQGQVIFRSNITVYGVGEHVTDFAKDCFTLCPLPLVLKFEE